MENDVPDPPAQVDAPPAPPLNLQPPPPLNNLPPPLNLQPLLNNLAPLPPMLPLPPLPQLPLPNHPAPNNVGNFVQNEQNGQRDFGPITTVTMSNGGLKFCFRGYYFVYHKEISDGKSTLRCERCNGDRETKCYARIHGKNGRCVYISIAEHNHPPNAIRKFQLQV